MAQQTAVEFLLEKLYTEYRFEFSGTIVEQAKEMEKQQIIKAHKLGFYYNLPDPIVEKNSEKYYNETYK